ncbi:hypothetical protein MAL1_00195 [Bacteriophage DSS3_MAL1]|nr:hypothetical protein MAL1_00195 [Bacteriophage DSS3_MAL1]
MTIWPELQEIIDRFNIAADAAVDRARRRVVEWRLRQVRIQHHEYTVTALEPGPGQEFLTYMGVPVQDLLDGKEDWPA